MLVARRRLTHRAVHLVSLSCAVLMVAYATSAADAEEPPENPPPQMLAAAMKALYNQDPAGLTPRLGTP